MCHAQFYASPRPSLISILCRDLWKEEAKLNAQGRHAADQLRSAEQAVSKTMDRDTASGLRAARAIATELGLDGYHGPLYELFEVEERYKTAVEVTAGTRCARFWPCSP